MCFERKPSLGKYHGTREEWITAYRHARQGLRVGREPDPKTTGLTWKAALIVHYERCDLSDPLAIPVMARLETARLVDAIKREPLRPATDYRVTLYATVRIPVDVAGAINPLDAVELAIKNTDLAHEFRGGEYADEITAALVDQVGDDELLRSETLLPGRSAERPWVESPSGASDQAEAPGADEIQKVLQLSTSHVSKKSFDWLNRAAATLGNPRCPGLHIGSYAFGAFISVPSDVRDLTDIATLQCPGDIKSVLSYAHSRGCEVVRMDSDAQCLDALPTFDW